MYSRGWIGRGNMRRKDRDRKSAVGRREHRPDCGCAHPSARPAGLAWLRHPAWLSALLAVLGTLALGASTSAASTLPDGRAWEQVSPSEKGGASIVPLGFGATGLLGGLIVSSEDGNSLTYAADAPTEASPEGNRAIEGNQIISRRTPQAWNSKDIVTPHNKGEGLLAGTDQEYQYFSADLSSALVVPFVPLGHRFMEPPLVGSEPEEKSI